MRRLNIFFITLLCSPFVVAEMTVDQAVTRLLKDLENVEIMQVPVPAPGQVTPGQGASGRTSAAAVPEALQTSGTYRVRRGETLDRVIRRLAPNSPLQRNVLRAAFVRANPHAFRRNNPNWMYAGAVLRIPDVEHLRQVIFKETPGDLKKDISDEKADWVRFP
jgi:Tfp pilus assembly protein FimV